MVDRLAAWQPLLFTPGSGFHYSNIGYDILGLVAEGAARVESRSPISIASGSSIGSRLDATAYDPQGPIQGPHARGYGIEPDGTRFDASDWHAGVGAEGGIVSNAEETARFLTALMQGKLVGVRQVEAMKGDTLWFGGAVTDCAGQAYGWSGGGSGYKTEVWVDGSGRRVAVLLLNARHWDTAQPLADAAAHDAMARMFAAPEAWRPPPIGALAERAGVDDDTAAVEAATAGVVPLEGDLPAPESELRRTEARADLGGRLACLDRREREVGYLRFFVDLTQDENREAPGHLADARLADPPRGARDDAEGGRQVNLRRARVERRHQSARCARPRPAPSAARARPAVDDARAPPGPPRCRPRARRSGRPQRRCVGVPGDLDRAPDQVGLQLHEEPVRRRAPVGAEHRDLEREHVEHVRDLVRERLQRRTDQMRARRSPGEPADQAARVGRPCGAPRPVSAGTKWAPSVESTLLASRSLSAERLDHAEAVAEPLRGRRHAHEHRALGGEARRGLGLDPPPRRRQALGGLADLLAECHEDECPGPVCRLRLPRREARLPEEGSLLVACDACDRDGGTEGGCLADHARRGDDLRQQRPVDAEQREQLVPLAGREVEQHRARGVGAVGDVCGAPGELPRASCRPSRRRGSRAGRSTRARIHSSFVAEKYGSGTSPVRRRIRSKGSSAQRTLGAAVLPLIAGCTGRLLPRSQTTVVSRWFVIPSDSRSRAATPTAASASAAVCSTLAQISSGSCSTHPGRGKCCRISRYPRLSTSRLGSRTRHVVPVVPQVDRQDHGRSRPAWAAPTAGRRSRRPLCQPDGPLADPEARPGSGSGAIAGVGQTAAVERGNTRSRCTR